MRSPRPVVVVVLSLLLLLALSGLSAGSSVSDASWPSDAHLEPLEPQSSVSAASAAASSSVLFPHVISSDDLEPSDADWDDPNTIKHLMQMTASSSSSGATTGAALGAGLALTAQDVTLVQCVPTPVLVPTFQFINVNASGVGAVDVNISLSSFVPTLNGGNWGSLTLQDIAGSGITLIDSTGVKQSSISFYAPSLTAANAALASLVYSPAQGLQGVNGTVYISVSGQDPLDSQVNALTFARIFFNANASYVPVSIYPIDGQTFSNLQSAVNETVHIPRLAVSQLANPDDELAVTFQAQSGLLTFGQTAGLYFVQTNQSLVWTFVGYLAAVNAALQSVNFTTICAAGGGCSSTQQAGFTLTVRDFANDTECPVVAALDCTLDVLPDQLQIIEAALPAPTVTAVVEPSSNSSVSWNVSWIPLTSADWEVTAFTGPVTAYSLLITTNTSTEGFTEVYRGLGLWSVLSNLTADTEYTVEVQIWSAAGLSVCPGIVVNGRSPCQPNPTSFFTGTLSSPGPASLILTGSSSDSLTLTLSPPADGLLDSLIASIFSGNDSSDPEALGSAYLIVPVDVAGGEVVEVITGLSPFTPYLIVVQARNQVGLGPATSVVAWTLLAGPAIVGFVASDPSNSNRVVSSGDVLTLTFDQPTNQPAVDSMAAVNALLSFSSPIAASYSGNWTTASTLVITLTTVTTQTPAIGILSVTVIGDLRSADLVSDVSKSTATLVGNWGTAGLQPLLVAPAVEVQLEENGQSYLGVSTNFTAAMLQDATSLYTLSVQLLSPLLPGAALNGSSGWSAGGILISSTNTAALLSSALASVLFTAPRDYFGSVSLQYAVLDSSQTLQAELVQVVLVTHVNHLPIITAPQTLTLPLEQTTAVTSIVVTDVDVPVGSLTDSMTVTLAASTGGLLSFSGSSSSGVLYAPSFTAVSSVFQLTGPLLAVNLALQALQLRFEQPLVQFGSPSLPFVLVTANDHGNGGQPALQNAQYIDIDIVCPAELSAVTPTAVSSAELSDTGNELIVSLSLPVSTAVLSSPFFSCASVFSSASVASFGSSPVCHWTSNQQLTVELGLGAALTAAQQLDVVANAFSRCGSSATPSAASSVSVQLSPSLTMAPVFISGPSVGSYCADLTLTAGAFPSSAHALSYHWTLPAALQAQPLLSSLDVASPTLTVPVAALTAVTSGGGMLPSLTFGLTVSNFLGYTQSAQWTVAFNTDAKPLITPLTDASITVYAQDAVDLFASASVPSCNATVVADVDSALQYSWSVVPALSGVVLGNDSSLHLPAGVLDYSANSQHVYTFTLTAALSSNAALFSLQQFTVVLAASPLQARIAGGLTLSIAPASALTVDASSSYDADASSSTSAAEYAFSWSCQTLAPSASADTQQCYATDGSVLSYPNAGLLAYPAGSLAPNSYVFTVRYSHPPSGRVAYASQTVLVMEPYTTALDLALDVAVDTINTFDKLAAAALASSSSAEVGSPSFSWSVIGADAALDLTAAVNSSGSLSALVLNAQQQPGFFTAGATYQLAVTATTAAGDSSFAAAAVYVNIPPSCSGAFTATSQDTAASSSPLALQSAFVLSIPAASCSDPDAAQSDSILYQFFRVDAASGLRLWLSAPAPVSSTAPLSLPSGSVTVGVRVLDRLGGYSEYSTTLQLSAAAGNVSEAGFLLSYNAMTESAVLHGDAVTVVAAAASVLSTAMASSLPSSSLLLLKDQLMMDVLSWSAALPDDYISSPLALFVSDPSSTSLQAVEYALTFVAALSAGDAMAGSVNQLQSVVRILDGVLGVIAASQSGVSGSGRRLLQTQQLDLNGLNSELFASLNSLALDISSQLMTVEGDALPVSAQRLSGIVRRGVVGNDSLTVSVAGSSLSVPAVAVSAAAGAAYDVALFVTPAADFEYLAQSGQVSDVLFVAAYAAASYPSPLAPHTATSALISSLLPSDSNYSVTLDVAFDPALAGSCLNTVDPVTGLVCSLQCRQWNGTDFVAAGVETDFLALNNASHTARCVLSQPGVLSLFTATESSSILLASSSSGLSDSSSGSAGDQAGAVRASVTFPAPFTIVNMKDFKQGLVQDLSFVTGEPAARFNVEQVTTNAANGLTTVIIDIWVPLASTEATSQSVYEQLAALSLADVLSTSYLRYADLSSWMEQCSDLVFRPSCSASSSSSAAWMLPLIIAASAAGFLLCCALTVLAVRRHYAAPAKDDKTVDDFTLPGAAGVAKQYIYSPPTAGKELDAEISRSEVSDVTIVASNSDIDPHAAGALHTGDEEISEPVIVESEAEAAELAKHGDSLQGSQRSAVDSVMEDDEKELSVSAAGQSRHFYYVDESVQRSELSRTDSASTGSASSSGRQQRLSVSQAHAAPASKSSSHFRIGHMGAAADGRREPSISGSGASVSSRGSAAGSQSMHFRYSDNEDSKSTSRTPSLPHLSHSPSHSAVSQQQTQDTEAFHTFSHLDLNAAADADTAAASSAAPGSTAAAAADKKPIKVIRPGAH